MICRRLRRLAASFAAVTVESHASTIGPRTLDVRRNRFRDDWKSLSDSRRFIRLQPRSSTSDSISRDSIRPRAYLSENGIDLRVFVLLGAPYVPFDESIEWTVRTVEYAVERGAVGCVDHSGARRKWRDGAASGSWVISLRQLCRSSRQRSRNVCSSRAPS